MNHTLPSHASIALENVVKQHGDTLAVNTVSLEIRPGEFFSLLGPSGSGKTTILRLIAGLDQPDEGRIVIQGHVMQDVAPQHRPVNIVFQQYALFPHMTVFKNVAFGLEMQKVSPQDITQRVAETLDLVQLSGKHMRVPSELSGGEQQRVALARALVNRPSVLLLDEPLGALDQQLRQEMQRELKTLQEQLGITFFYVTHHQEEALTMSDRIAVMHNGQLLQVGSPQELYQSPATPFVAEFVGRSNRLDGTVVSIQSTHATLETKHVPPIHIPKPEEPTIHHSMTLILRPEWIHLTKNDHESGFDNHLPACIRNVQYLGNEFHYRLEVTPDIFWTATVPILGHQHAPFQTGEQVFIDWKTHDSVVLSTS
ncbi:MAG: polyamine ABC transporter ATP-binding protein [Nitrospirales bacterium]|nr:polyamine ABC transporter ATP-binding protein [Nitrospirales bacterium]